jgi:hypothetical protein
MQTSLQNQKLTVPAMRLVGQEAVVNASNSTVRRRLNAAGLNGHLAVKKPLLSVNHLQLPLEFACHYEHWS